MNKSSPADFPGGAALFPAIKACPVFRTGQAFLFYPAILAAILMAASMLRSDARPVPARS